MYSFLFSYVFYIHLKKYLDFIGATPFFLGGGGGGGEGNNFRTHLQIIRKSWH